MAQGRAPFASKRTPAQSRRWLPPLPSGPTPKVERPGDLRCSGLPGAPPGCPPTPNADMGGARPGPGGRGGRGGRGMGVRTSHPVLPCPALPCRVSRAHCSAQHGTKYGYGYLVSFCFASGPTTDPIWSPSTQAIRPPDHVKHHAVYINPEGPQSILSQLTPLSPSCSPDTPV